MAEPSEMESIWKSRGKRKVQALNKHDFLPFIQLSKVISFGQFGIRLTSIKRTNRFIDCPNFLLFRVKRRYLCGEDLAVPAVRSSILSRFHQPLITNVFMVLPIGFLMFSPTIPLNLAPVANRQSLRPRNSTAHDSTN